MKKFQPISLKVNDTQLLQTELETAAPFGPLRIGNTHLFYVGVISTQYLPLADIAWVYIRKEDNLTSMGCRRVSILESFLVLVTTTGTQKKLSVIDGELGNFFEALKEILPDVKVGYHTAGE